MLKFTAEHEWLKIEGDVATVGITDYAQNSLGDITNRAEAKKIPESYRKFEAMVLQNFLKYMMPNDSEDVYGKGMAGDIWKSMSA